MNTSALVEWQRIDPDNGLIEPWLTHPFMDWVKTLDLSRKVILEFGAGRSSAWWRKKSAWVNSIEANSEWALQAEKDCDEANLSNGIICWDREDNINDGMADIFLDKYLKLIPIDYEVDGNYDIIIIDGIYRTEIVEWAIKYFKNLKKEGLLLIDNLDQDFVWISPKAMELIEPYESEVFIQPGHSNHEGKPWNTRWVKIPA